MNKQDQVNELSKELVENHEKIKKFTKDEIIDKLIEKLKISKKIQEDLTRERDNFKESCNEISKERDKHKENYSDALTQMSKLNKRLFEAKQIDDDLSKRNKMLLKTQDSQNRQLKELYAFSREYLDGLAKISKRYMK